MDLLDFKAFDLPQPPSWAEVMAKCTPERMFRGFRRGEMAGIGTGTISPIPWPNDRVATDMEASLQVEHLLTTHQLVTPRLTGKTSLYHGLFQQWIRGKQYHRPTYLALKIKQVLGVKVEPYVHLKTYVDRYFDLRPVQYLDRWLLHQYSYSTQDKDTADYLFQQFNTQKPRLGC